MRADKLGFLYLSRVLKNSGHSVDMFQDDEDNIEEYLSKNQVDFVMYSVFSGEHRWYIEKNRELKKKFNFISVVGGPHFTFFTEDAENDENIDFCVIGPGEKAILDIVEGRTKDKIVRGHICQDINEIPEPDRTMLYKYDGFGKSSMKRFIAGRDCPNSCKYCFNHLFHKLYQDEKKYFFQITKVDKIIQEIINVKNEYGLELAFFNDDDFGRDHKWLEEFCEKFKSKVGIHYGTSVRANNVNKEILKMMADSGCITLHISLESASQETQKLLRRGSITNEQVIDACRYSEEFGMRVKLQNMIGLPVDDPVKDALETLELNQELNVTNSWAGIYQPFPKTDLWKYCIEKKLIDENTECLMFEEDTVLKFPDAEKINTLHKWWYFATSYKLPIDLIKILIDQPLDKEIKRRLREYTWNLISKDYYKI